MLTANENYKNVKQSYLFAEIGRRVNAYAEANPDKKVIRMGIGDVTLPLCDAVVSAMHKAVDEMGSADTFRGYGPEQGYSFLSEKIQAYYKTDMNVELALNEIFISDGAKSDVGNILDLFAKDNTVLIPDPVYPVYMDTNTMDGHNIIFANADESNGFLPMPQDDVDADIIYLCSPNNPTGAVYNKEQLTKWVEYANKKGAVILFDAAYESFVADDCPRSIFTIPGARTCAIEFCSLSKTAGFTGTRCGYTVVPEELVFGESSLNKMWLRRQTTKFNGVSYIVQRGAEAVFTPEGQKQIRANIDYYRENAKIITDTMDELNIWYTGGQNSPYIWLKCPGNMKSWEFFDLLLEKANVVGTPGAGFGDNGEGFFRLTAFNNHENTKEAMERLKAVLKEI